jgi:hypothetical protein
MKNSGGWLKISIRSDRHHFAESGSGSASSAADPDVSISTKCKDKPYLFPQKNANMLSKVY